MPEVTEKLQDSIDETAKIARTSLLFFLVVALYLLIIVGTTTDLMLLRGEIVALPLMEVGVPVVVFYIVAPLIFLLLHINLLLRLKQLTETVSRWERNSVGPKDEQSSLVFPLDFARLLLAEKPRWALYTVVVTQIYILPIVVLLALQMSFLAYQNSFITLWHQLIVTTDLVLLFLFVCFVIGTRGEKKVDCNYVLKMFFQRWKTVFSAGLVLIFAWTIAVVPNSLQETVGIFVAMFVGLFFLLSPYVSKHWWGTIFSAGLVLIFAWVIAVVPNSWQEAVGMNTDDFCFAVDDSQERSIQQRLLTCQRQLVARQRQLLAWVFADWWEGYPITSYRPVRRFLNVAEQPIALTEAPPEIVGALIIKEVKLKVEKDKLKAKK